MGRRTTQIELQVPHMQEARVNSRCNDDLEPKVCWAGNESSVVPRISESECKPRLSGPSIRRTIAGAVDLRCKFRPDGGGGDTNMECRDTVEEKTMI